MLEACLEIFERQPDIDKLILDTYAPAEGTYVIMAYENGQFVHGLRLKKIKRVVKHCLHTESGRQSADLIIIANW